MPSGSLAALKEDLLATTLYVCLDGINNVIAKLLFIYYSNNFLLIYALRLI